MEKVNKSLEYWVKEMNTAEQNNNIKKYNECVENIQALEYLQGF